MMMDGVGKHAVERPTRDALVFGRRRLTYEALNRAACGLAAHLRDEHQVAPSQTVALQVEDPLLFVAALLGLEMLDVHVLVPGLGQADRFNVALLEPARVDVLIADGHTGSNGDWSGRVVNLAAGHLEHLGDEAPAVGDPAGESFLLVHQGHVFSPPVEMTRSGMDHMAAWLAEESGMTGEAVVAVEFGPDPQRLLRLSACALLVGATVVFYDHGVAGAAPQLVDFIAGSRVSHLELPVPAIRVLAERLLHGSRHFCLKCVLTFDEGAGSISVGDLKALAGIDGFKGVLSIYGRAENSFAVSFRWLTETTQGGDRFLIGKAVPGVAAVVFDKKNRLAPTDVVGGVFVGGRCLAAGYRGGGPTGAGPFIANPYKQGSRLFDLGERGRRLADGSLELVRSETDAVSLHGVHLEPAVLESVILDCNGVSACAFEVRTGAKGGRHLVVFIVGEPHFRPEILRDHLAAMLSAHVMPYILQVPLPALPLVEAGRVDRRALSRYSVISSETLGALEQGLMDRDDVADIALSLRQVVAEPPALHLDDLLTDDETVVRGQSDAGPEAVDLMHIDSNGQLERPALSVGADFDEPPAKTLPACLMRTIENYPQHGISFLRADGSETRITYGDLLEQAKPIMAGLRAAGVVAGRPVIIQLERNEDIVAVFWAAVLAGCVGVPLAVPRNYSDESDALRKLVNVHQLLDDPIVVGDGPTLSGCRSLLGADAHVVALADLKDHAPMEPPAEVEPDETAIFLFTSGSTGLPKCIQLRHRNVVYRSLLVTAANGFTPEVRALNWMPLDHVGGIVMFHLRDVCLGSHQYLAQTSDVVEDPLRWIDWMDRYRINNSWAPNFAYALVADATERMRGRNWDLSCIKHLLNGGEAVSFATMRAFVNALAPFGLSDRAVFPAYGMSETSSGITRSTRLSPGDGGGLQHIDKTSLTGPLRKVAADHPNATCFVEVGEPIHGVSIRIVDQDNRLLPEMRIGRVQAMGPTIMKGYYRNPEANRAFVGDGWFNTGDLGFLDEGRLTITGREKDVIIINGINYHNYEIEIYVEEVAGVAATFSAACPVANPRTGLEELAVFFVPNAETDLQPGPLINAVRRQVIEKLGLNPAHIIPIEREAFPKTNSGKKQRNVLIARFEEGAFRAIQKEIDLYEGNERTLPNRFFLPVWRRRVTRPETSPLKGDALIFRDGRNTWRALKDELTAGGGAVFTVGMGDRFSQDGSFDFTVRPGVAEDYACMFQVITKAGVQLDHVFHLWLYEPMFSGAVDVAGIQRDQERGLFSLLFTLRAMALREAAPLNLWVITTQACAIEADLALGKTTLQGFLRTVPAESTHITCRHIDSDDVDDKLLLERLRAENRAAGGVVAYRGERRLTPCLEPVDFDAERLRPGLLKRGAFYVISGGLGAIGYEVARVLLSRYDAHLLLLGRTPIGDGDGGERARRLAKLKALSQRVAYCALDIRDEAGLKNAVAEWEARWESKLAGVFQLAGSPDLRDHWENPEAHWVTVESRRTFETMFEAKMYGSLALAGLLDTRPDAVFVGFSSVNSYFGGSAFSAYAAANSFLDHLCADLTRRGRQARCLNWSMWDEMGMNRGNQMKQAAVARGFTAMSGERNTNAFLAAMHLDHEQIMIGLDGGNDYIRRYLGNTAPPENVVSLYAAAGENGALDQAAVLAFARTILPERTRLECRVLETIPRDDNGLPDWTRLSTLTGAGQGVLDDSPRTPLERKLADIWREVLGKSRVGVHDNFFELGGQSIKAAQIVSRVRHGLNMELNLTELFKNPTIAGIAALAAQQESGPEKEPIPVLPESEHYAVSHSQRRLWFLDQMDHESFAYNVPGAFLFDGDFKVEAFRKSVAQLVRRHEVLRTTFIEADGEPRQKVHRNMVFEVDEADLSQQPEPLEAARLEALREALKPFNLALGPLLKVFIRQVGPARFVMFFNMHHIISDGWSTGVMVKELVTLYRAFAAGVPPRMPALRLQYRDFAAWQNARLESGSGSRDYWHARLGGSIPVMNLPTDHARPNVRTSNGRNYVFTIDGTRTEGLRSLCQRQGASLFMGLLAVVDVLLHRYTGLEDIIVGAPMAGREHPDLENQIGFYLNTLALRNQVDPDESFANLLERVKRNTTADFDHADYPFDKLVDELDVSRDLARTPLFSVMIMLQNYDRFEMAFDGVKVSGFDTGFSAAKLDIGLTFTAKDGGLEVITRYSTALFDEARMARLQAHLTGLMDDVLANPDQMVGALRLLDPAAYAPALPDFAAPAEERVRDTVTSAFERQAARTPDRPALVQGARGLSYRELNREADRIAGLCRRLQVGDGGIAAVAFGADIRQIAALIGVFKAGAVYLPFDLNWPEQRVRQVLRKSRPALLLVPDDRLADTVALLKRLGESIAHVIGMDESFGLHAQNALPLLEDLSDENPARLDDPDGDSYIFYTSGSTGEPKAILGRHNSLYHFIDWQSRTFGIDAECRGAQLTRFTFDASLRDIFVPLCNGGRLHLPPDEGLVENLAHLLEWLADTGVTILHTVPSLARVLMKQAREGSDPKRVFRRLNHLFIGGEQLFTDDIAAWRDLFGGHTQIVNFYGATEATLIQAFYPIVELAAVPGRRIPAGEGVGGNLPAVLRGTRQCVVGEVGEIFIKSPYLSKGYYGEPERTNQVFVVNPLAPETGERVYWTGDLGRYLADGNIEVLGRRDDQLKLNGIRVELGEIEAAVSALPGVSQAVAAPDPIRENTLICFYTGGRLECSLRQDLVSVLPGYMLPASFVRLEKLPLNANGKVDRRALPIPKTHQSTGDAAPMGPTEERLAAIWADVLGLDQVGAEDSFFEVGGHSLKATRLVARIHRDFDVALSLREVFANATVRGLARLIASKETSAFTAIEPVPVQPHYPLSHAQRRLWILHQMEDHPISYNMKYAILFRGPLCVAAMHRAFENLVARHESTRTTFASVEGTPRQFIHDEPAFNYRRLDFSEEPDSEALAREEAAREVNRVFDLEKGPLVRFCLIKLSNDGGQARHVLLFSMHHIIGDGWSLGVLAREVLALYEAYVQERENPLPPLRVQYKDYAAWQLQRLEGDLAEGQRAYWHERLAGPLPALALPADFPRPDLQTFKGGTLSVSLDEHLSEGLNRLARAHEATLFMTLSAVLKVLLYRYSGQSDLIVGSPIAGRNHVELEDQIGFYVNTLALRDQLSGDMPFLAFLQAVKANTARAFDHADYPFDRLVDELPLARDVSRSPIFDVMLVLQNQEIAALKADGLAIEKFEKVALGAKFDLTVTCMEVQGRLAIDWEYNRAIYKAARIACMFDHFRELVRHLCDHPETTLDSAPLLSKAERAMVLESFNDTRVAFRENETLADVFEAAASVHPNAPALRCGSNVWTYARVAHEANRLAAFLRHRFEIGADRLVGILSHRSEMLMTAILAVFKAGGGYVPLDPNQPVQRLAVLARRTSVLLVGRDHLDLADSLQQETDAVRDFVCLETPHANDFSLIDSKAGELWDHVAVESEDAIGASGWVSSYTGEQLSDGEMGEMVQNVITKVSPYLGDGSRVLEVGCGSGLILFELASRVGYFHGVDISQKALDLCAARASREGRTNIGLERLSAHDIDQVGAGPFDVVIVNSVIQYFPNYRYLRAFIDKALALLAPNGVLLIGDVRDHALRDDFYESLYDGGADGLAGWLLEKRRTDNELFVRRDFWHDQALDYRFQVSAEASDKIHTLENELTRYRYDVVLRVDKRGPGRDAREAKRRRYLNPADYLADYPGERLQGVVREPGALAYVLFTSGSTGEPKGVMVSHRALMNNICWMDRRYELRPEDVVLQKTPITFDVSAWELFWWFFRGASVCMLPPEGEKDPGVILETVADHGVTMMHFVPSMMPPFLDHVVRHQHEAKALERVRLVLASGEAITPDQVNAFHNTWPCPVPLDNLYGPTEATVHVTYYRCEKQEDNGPIPIGKPVANTAFYILEAGSGEPAPIGLNGELCIAGECLARGYLGKPEMTAERFTPNPFGDGTRLYRTGDLGQWLPDGEIRFLGRLDNQVKLRGFRVELGEIELALGRYPAVRKAAVTLRVGADEHVELVAHVVADQPVDGGAMKQFLALSLPDYMLPDQFIQREAFPLTASGKLDRKALAAANLTRVGKVDLEPPESDTERELFAVWESLFGKNDFGVNQSFFEIGGHSLRALNLVSAIHTRLQVELPLMQVYRTPTIRALAAYLDNYRRLNLMSAEQVYHSFNPGKSRAILGFPPVIGFALSYAYLADLIPDCTIHSFNFISDRNRLQTYVEAIRELDYEHGHILLGYSAGGFMAFHLARALEAAGQPVAALVILDAYRGGREGREQDPDAIRTGVDQFVRSRPELSDYFFKSQYLREKTYKQVQAYYDFLFEAGEHDQINAPIHLIQAEENHDKPENWSPLTRGGVVTWRGGGIHSRMLEQPFIVRNAEVIRGIMDQVLPALDEKEGDA